MYVDVSSQTKKGQTYQRVLLRESYRENGIVKKRTIANLGKCSQKEIDALKLAFKHKNNLTEVGSIAESITIKQGASIGAVLLVREICKKLGIATALGDSRQGKLALWQVIARVIDQGSRLSAVRFAANHAACDLLNTETFHEEHLYANLDWLHENQEKIETNLFCQIYGKEKAELFLYDVTSSYLEGEQNELGAFGYNRDKKRGKLQIVIGLLCDHAGVPLSIEVFPGNTIDTKTFSNQISKVAERFGGKSVTFVGDRGMIKGPQIKELQTYEDYDFHYITAITKPQLEKLLREDQIQLSFFDHGLGEIQIDDGIRYVLRRNPERTREIRQSREGKYQALHCFVEKQNKYLLESPKAKLSVAERKINDKSVKLKIDKWILVSSSERVVSLSKEMEQLKKVEKLDGCYVLKTDLQKEKISKEIVHSRYKDLALVEWAFRTSKTVQLEMRPINVRLERRTRGHAFVVMLAYKVVRELAANWKSLDLTVEEGLKELDALCSTEIKVKDGKDFHSIPQPRQLSQQLLDAANVKLPSVLSNKGVIVATKKKLQTRRKKM
jgi:transposase